MCIRDRCTTDGKHVVRIDRTFRNAGACLNLITLRDNQTGTKGNQIGTALPRLRIGNDGMTVFLDLLEGDLAGNLTDDSKMLRLAALKQLFNARQTLRNIFRTGNAAGVEGSHGQLRARLADGRCV